jgi:hypothetical protein
LSRTPLVPGTVLLAALLLALPARGQEPAAPEPSPGASPSPSPEPSPAPSTPTRTVTAIEITGLTRLDKETVWDVMGVKPGGRLRRDPAELGALLEYEYHAQGYAAARAQVRFDEATGTLHVSIDEGTLAAVEVEGVRPSEREPVLALLDLETGKPFNDEEVADALRRLDSASASAYEAQGDPPYTLEPGEGGVRLTLKLRQRTARFIIRPGGTARTALLNRVDGFTPGATTEVLLFVPSALNPVEAYVLADFGFGSEQLRWAAGARRRFGARGRLVLGYEHHDFTDTDDTFRALGVEQLRGWHLFFTTFQDYYVRRGDEAYAFLRPSPRVHLGVNLRRDAYESLPVVSDGSLFTNPDPPPNPAVVEGRARAAVFTARWAWKAPLFEDWRQERDALLVRDAYGTPFRRAQTLRAEATYETSDGEEGRADLSFQRFIASAHGAARLALRHWVLGAVTVGTGSEGLPEQRRFSLGGQGTLRGRESNEVQGERMVLASAEWHIEPNAPLPALILFYDGGTAWDRGLPRATWRHDAGAGLAWPPTESRFVRVDAAWPLNAVTGDRKPRVTGYVRLPF